MAAAECSGLDRAVLVVFRQAVLAEIDIAAAWGIAEQRAVSHWIVDKAADAELDFTVGPPRRHGCGHRCAP